MEDKEESSTKLGVDEVELVLRRFAMEKNDQPLTKLLNSMFTETAQQKADHENASEDASEDKKEGE